MSLATVPCGLPSTGTTGMSLIVIGVFAIAVGIVLTRFTARKHRLPLTLILLLVASICASAPQSASASPADCSSTPTATLPPIHWRLPSDSTPLDCDNISPAANIGYVTPIAGVGTFTGYGAYEFTGFLPTYFKFDDARSWINGYLPTTLTHEWQIFSGGRWSAATWDTGSNPLVVTDNQALFDEIINALTVDGTVRLLIHATDGTTDQVCAVVFWEDE